YIIEGELVGVDVDVPPSLEALAMLERKRPDTEMFPMRLDARGQLQPRGDPGAASEEVKQAAVNVATTVQSLAIGGFDRTQATNFAKAIEQHPVRTPWPEDLF